jgi:hypothetical protein
LRTKEELKAAQKLLKLPAGSFEAVDFSMSEIAPEDMTRCFRNNRYLVMIFDNAKTSYGTARK